MDEFARAQLTEALVAYREYMHIRPGSDEWSSTIGNRDWITVFIGTLGEALVTIGDEVGDTTFTYGREA